QHRHPHPLPATPAWTPVDHDSFYAQLADHGLHYSGAFTGLDRLGHDPAHPEVIHAEIALPTGIEAAGYGIHPALLDAALHPLVST
ncbi:polyketide synthase dehydratase domain-containing protein, partial [Mycobacterium szulgai]